MGKFTFDDDDQQEPTFSLADFKKWLNKQGKGDPNLKNEEGAPEEKEVVEESQQPPRDDKEEFKEKLRKRRRSKKKED